MRYIINGLDPAPYSALYGLSDRELAKQGAVRMDVTAKPGFPCRISLEDAAVGATVLLFNHSSRQDKGPYHASHAIFVEEGASVTGQYIDQMPSEFDGRTLSLRGFDSDGMMVDAALSKPSGADAALRNLFKNSSILEIDIHNATRGCFAARARRMD